MPSTNPNDPVLKAMQINLRNLVENLPAPYNVEPFPEIVKAIAGVASAAAVQMSLHLKEGVIPPAPNGNASVEFMNKLISTSLRLAADHVDMGTVDYLRVHPQEA